MKARIKIAGLFLGAALTVTLTACNPPSTGGGNNYYSSSYSSPSKPKITVKNFVGARLDEAINYFKAYGAGDDSITRCEAKSYEGKIIIEQSNWKIIDQSVKGNTIYFTCTQIIDYGEIVDLFLN